MILYPKLYSSIVKRNSKLYGKKEQYCHRCADMTMSQIVGLKLIEKC